MTTPNLEYTSATAAATATSVPDENGPPSSGPPDSERRRFRRYSSAISLVLLALYFATFFLLSPRPGQHYPGERPWSPNSLLAPLLRLLALEGVFPTARGAEIKDVAFHVAAAIGLLLLGLKLWSARPDDVRAIGRQSPWAAAQILLAAWAGLSILSASWSSDPAASLGQAAIYALALAWAVAVGWTLEQLHFARACTGVFAITAAAGGLCIWWYFERNPNHRPGFPVGNPGPLASSMVPALLIGAALLVQRAQAVVAPAAGGASGVVRAALRDKTVLAILAGMVPLAGCFVLADSRGAQLGLFSAIVFMAVVLLWQAGRRLRWVLLASAAGGAMALVLLWYFYASSIDAQMARGASVRFRLYAWHYAAKLWESRPMLGHGAGAYPRLAGQFSGDDRMLDPDAFMGELVEHAHNELFEVFTEIGLVGGITFVAAGLATLASAVLLVSAARGRPQRWLYLALGGSVVAIFAGSLFDVGLRLPGLPAICYTLIGLIWAAARWQSADQREVSQRVARVLELAPDEENPAGDVPPDLGAARKETAARVRPTRLGGSRSPMRLWGVAALCGSLGAFVLAALNAYALHQEAGAIDYFEAGHLLRAGAHYAQAERLLFDPVRRLLCAERIVECDLGLAEEMHRRALEETGSATQPVRTTSQQALAYGAISSSEQTYLAAASLARRAPRLLQTGVAAARAAQMLADLHRVLGDAAAGAQWQARAEDAWRVQREWTPFDRQTLLALASVDPAGRPRYHGNTAYRLGLLRDALRSQTSTVLPEWVAALRSLLDRPDFDAALQQLVAAAGPIDPQTDLDAVIASMAPETYRLAAAVHALRGDLPAAERDAARAAALYLPMRRRFSTLHSAALAEQGYYALRQGPDNAARAAPLFRRAIDELPTIQQQKFEELARPYREFLIFALLASGQEAAAVAELKGRGLDDDAAAQSISRAYEALAANYIALPAGQRPDLQHWLERARALWPGNFRAWADIVLLDAESSDWPALAAHFRTLRQNGIAPANVESLVAALCEKFPDRAEQIRSAASGRLP